MNTMSYKGFLGSVSFSEQDGVFFGEIVGVDGIVNFEGDSVTGLVSAFHDAVDDYIAYCEENGIKAHKSYTGSLNVRLSPQTHVRVATLARQAGISINAFIKDAVEQKIASII